MYMSGLHVIYIYVSKRRHAIHSHVLDKSKCGTAIKQTMSTDNYWQIKYVKMCVIFFRCQTGVGLNVYLHDLWCITTQLQHCHMHKQSCTVRTSIRNHEDCLHICTDWTFCSSEFCIAHAIKLPHHAALVHRGIIFYTILYNAYKWKTNIVLE